MSYLRDNLLQITRETGVWLALWTIIVALVARAQVRWNGWTVKVSLLLTSLALSGIFVAYLINPIFLSARAAAASYGRMKIRERFSQLIAFQSEIAGDADAYSLTKEEVRLIRSWASTLRNRQIDGYGVTKSFLRIGSASDGRPIVRTVLNFRLIGRGNAIQVQVTGSDAAGGWRIEEIASVR